jgi:haloacetate dehalogenase
VRHHDPATVHAMCEDYRAGLGVDREHDEADRAAGRRVACPTLFLWSTRDDLEALYGDPLAIWRAWAEDVRGMGIDSGHHIGEDAPEALAEALVAFAGASRRGRDAARPATRR